MAQHGKKYKTALANIDREALYSVTEAVDLAKGLANANFDETVGGLDESNALYEARRCMSCGNCFSCDNCYGMCPDNAIIKHGSGHFEINLEYCKGCGICASECPCGAIEMIEQHV